MVSHVPIIEIPLGTYGQTATGIGTGAQLVISQRTSGFGARAPRAPLDAIGGLYIGVGKVSNRVTEIVTYIPKFRRTFLFIISEIDRRKKTQAYGLGLGLLRCNGTAYPVL